MSGVVRITGMESKVDRRRLALVALLAAVLATVLPAAAMSAHAKKARGDSAVTSWIDIELAEIASHRTNPPRAARALALVSVAMRDAARGPKGLQDATVAGAASTVFSYLFPDRAGTFDELARREDPRKAVERGRRIGERIVARGRTDGSDAVFQGATPVGPGLWVSTSPGFLPPLEPLAGSLRPWNLRFGSQFRPPTAFGTAAYAAETREVYDVGQSLTDEQKRIADFWADGPGTVTPPGHWNQIALDLVRAEQLSTRAAAEVFAALNTAQADAFITCWDSKFNYWSERPVTAIRREIDPTWSPYITTPPFPSYVSGHSTTSGAASEVLARYFPRDARELRAWAQEAAVSRLYGGIHFRSDNDAGLALGKKVAGAAIAAYDAAPVEKER